MKILIKLNEIQLNLNVVSVHRRIRPIPSSAKRRRIRRTDRNRTSPWMSIE